MNGLTLDQWVRKMTHFDNGGDALCLYALSDMLGVHTMVLTTGKAWTTVHGNYLGSLDDVLQLSDVKLVYLGQDRYAVLWKKVSPDDPSLRERSYNYNPMLLLAHPPSQVEMETAETLVNMQRGTPLVNTSSDLPHPPEFVSPNVSPDADAMDKITNRYDINLSGRPLNRDAMDQIIGLDELIIMDVHSLCVGTEPDTAEQDMEMDLRVETSISPSPADQQTPVLPVETFALKECSVRLRSLESILFSGKDDNKQSSAKKRDTPPTTAPAVPKPRLIHRNKT